jgi:hypothetical protein
MEIIKKIKKGDLGTLLSISTNDELEPLVQIIIDAATNHLDINETYKIYQPNHTKYYDLIEDEIRLFGSDSLVSMLRGKGITYDEVVVDICKRLKVPFDIADTIKNEENLLDLYNIEKERLNVNMKTIKSDILKLVTSRLLLGPTGTALLVFQVSGPAFRVTVPCVLYIAELRKKKIKELTDNLNREILNTNQFNSHFLEKFDTFTIKNKDNNEEILFFTRVSPNIQSQNWKNINDKDKNISTLNPLFSLVPSLMIANDIQKTNYMEVVIKAGNLTNAKDGNGYIGIVIGSNGKITEHARLFDPEKLSNLVNASALFQIASVVVAQKHLADINEKLIDIKNSVENIEEFQKNQRKTKIIGTIEYFEQVASSVFTGEFSIAILNQIEAKECELIEIQKHLIIDIESLTKKGVEDKDKVGTGDMTKEIQKRQNDIFSLYEQLLLVIQARGCGLQLLSRYPNNDKLIESRKASIREMIHKLKKGYLLNEIEESINEKIIKISSIFNKETTLNERKLHLIQNQKNFIADINRGIVNLNKDFLSIEKEFIEFQNPSTKMLLKIEDDKVVATSLIN